MSSRNQTSLQRGAKGSPIKWLNYVKRAWSFLFCFGILVFFSQTITTTIDENLFQWLHGGVWWISTIPSPVHMKHPSMVPYMWFHPPLNHGFWGVFHVVGCISTSTTYSFSFLNPLMDHNAWYIHIPMNFFYSHHGWGRNLCSKAPGSWKNVISLGDGPAERRALQERPGAEPDGIPWDWWFNGWVFLGKSQFCQAEQDLPWILLSNIKGFSFDTLPN